MLDPRLSSTGRFVAFTAYTVSPPAPDIGTDVFVLDRDSGRIRQVSDVGAGEVAH